MYFYERIDGWGIVVSELGLDLALKLFTLSVDLVS